MGSLRADSGNSVKLNMTEFWISLHRSKPRLLSERDDTSTFDVIVNWLSRAGFVEGISSFPVIFFDEEAGICVFRFPPLNSRIAAVRVSKP